MYSETARVWGLGSGVQGYIILIARVTRRFRQFLWKALSVSELKGIGSRTVTAQSVEKKSLQEVFFCS